MSRKRSRRMILLNVRGAQLAKRVVLAECNDKVSQLQANARKRIVELEKIIAECQAECLHSQVGFESVYGHSAIRQCYDCGKVLS